MLYLLDQGDILNSHFEFWNKLFTEVEISAQMHICAMCHK